MAQQAGLKMFENVLKKETFFVLFAEGWEERAVGKKISRDFR